MIGLIALAAALAVDGQRSRGRAQELQGRLGMRAQVKRRRSDLRTRLTWALETFPGSRMWLTLLFSNKWTPLSDLEYTGFRFNNTPPYQGAGPSKYRQPDEARFPDHVSGGPQTWSDRWPLPGLRLPALEPLIPWMARYFATKTPDEVYTDIRDSVEEIEKHDFFLGYAQYNEDNREPEEIYQSPWDEVEEGYIEEVYERSWLSSEKRKDIQDPYLADLRDKESPDQFDYTWGKEHVEEVPIAELKMTFTEDVEMSDRLQRSGHPWDGAEVFTPVLRVTDPDDPTAWLEFTWSGKSSSRLFAWREDQFHLTGIGSFEKWDELDDDGDLVMWRWAGPQSDWREAARKAIAREQPMSMEQLWHIWSGWLPEVKNLFPTQLYEPFEDLDDDDRRVYLPRKGSSAVLDPEELPVLWQLRWLIESATAWVGRIQQLQDDLWPKAFKLITDEVLVAGHAGITGAAYGPMSPGSALEWAQAGHVDRANARWWENHRDSLGQGESDPLPMLAADILLMEWPDGSRIVELSDGEALRREGDAMNHCIGGHSNYIQTGARRAFSYRDADNRPMATWEVMNSAGFPEADMQGRGNGPLSVEDEHIRPRILAFLRVLRGGERLVESHERSRLFDQGDVSEEDIGDELAEATLHGAFKRSEWRQLDFGFGWVG